MLEEQTFLIRELKIRLVTKSHVISQEGETWNSLEVEKGIHLVSGYNWDCQGSRNEFSQKWEKGIYLVEG